MTIDEIMAAAPVIPVLVLDGSIDPIALAETLVEAGLPVIEVTLRTPSAFDAVPFATLRYAPRFLLRRIVRWSPNATLSAPSKLNSLQLENSVILAR